MRVAFLLGGFNGKGGIGRAVATLADCLAKEDGIEVFTVSYASEEAENAYAPAAAVRRLSLGFDRVSMLSAMLRKHAVAGLSSIIQENNIEIIIPCGALFFPLALLCAKRCRIKCICCEHTSPQVESDYRFQSLGRKAAIHKADRIVVLTKAAQQYYVDVLGARPEKTEQIYNILERNAAQSAAYDIDSKKIISVGRLSYPKNFERLIRLAQPILREHPDWCWDIYGEGELHDALQTQIDGCGLSGRLTLKGNDSRLYSRYGNYAFCVMTSRYEGFPMSLLEAAANRLPLVAFDVPTGPAEIISDGKNGFLVPDDDGAMNERILQLIGSGELRKQQSDAAYQTSLFFTPERIIPQWRSLLQRVGEN